MATKIKRVRRAPEHYVNNKDFTAAVIDYVTLAAVCESDGNEVPPIPPYIGECFLRVAEGYSTKPKWKGYSYREDMVMDGVAKCVVKIRNFDPTKGMKGPNAFAYFTSIVHNAFLLRLNIESREADMRERVISQGDTSMFMHVDDEFNNGSSVMERMKSRREAWFGDE